MAKKKSPVTQATRFLKDHDVVFTEHPYKYEEKGGTSVSSRELMVEEHAVIKTLIMEDEKKNSLIILMHGDMEVSTKELARHVGVKTISPCTADTAQRHSGYQIGGTSPFGTRKQIPVYVEETILQLETIYINGGKRGFLIGVSPAILPELLAAETVNVGI